MVDCSGLENLTGKPAETAEMAEFCRFPDAHHARFPLRSACCDGTYLGTPEEKAFRRHLGWINFRDRWRAISMRPLAPAPVEYVPEPDTGLSDLYFIQSGESGPIKIGITGMKIERRMKALQTAHPYRLRLLILVKGEATRETEYHASFTEHRLEGEWFAPHEDILAEIERLKADAP